MVLVLGILGISLLGSAFFLWFQWSWISSLGLPTTLQASSKLEATKTATTIVLGGGGAVALYLAARRQRSTEREVNQRLDAQNHAEAESVKSHEHAERVAASTELDAQERRITELYAKAADMRGSDQAPVRLVGLCLLERVANDNPEHRPTVVNILCSYLRMHFTPPVRKNDREGSEQLEVRQAAQNILESHLRPTLPGQEQRVNPQYWPESIDIDLKGANLVDVNFAHCRLGNADFRGATFTGMAKFSDVEFLGTADFRSCAFRVRLHFERACVRGRSWFGRSSFSRGAFFSESSYSYEGDPNFSRAKVLLEGEEGSVWPPGRNVVAIEYSEHVDPDEQCGYVKWEG